MTLRVTKDNTLRVVEGINALRGESVLIGIPGDKAQRADGEVTNVMLGYIHEFGSPVRNIPPRPFLHTGVVSALPRITPLMAKGAKAALDSPSSVTDVLNKIGLIAQAAVKNVIVQQEGFTPLKTGTIAVRQRKGYKGTKALIRTGQLLNSITYVVRTM